MENVVKAERFTKKKGGRRKELMGAREIEAGAIGGIRQAPLPFGETAN